MTKTGKPIIAIHILPNISRSKDNQTMNFGMLIEYNMRNIFHDKSLVADPEIEHISGSVVLGFIQFLFIICQVEDDRNASKRNCKPLAFTCIKFFKKTKEMWH